MNYNIKQEKIAWLTYLVYILLSFLTLTSVFNSMEIKEVKKDYVTIERYKCDTDRIYTELSKISLKLDGLYGKLAN